MKKLFLSVGSRFPMDRLILAVDQFIGENSGYSCIAQIGDSALKPQHIEYYKTLNQRQFNIYADEADLIVSHAGMGNIILASELNKPIVIIPRRAHLKEIINDHQLGTIKGFTGKHGIFAVKDEQDIKEAIPRAIASSRDKDIYREREQLINNLRSYINSLNERTPVYPKKITS